MSTVLGKRIDGDQLALLCARHGLRIGFVHQAYDQGTEIVVVGEPADDHNCDAMGCGQMHVVRRIPK